jgi:Transposase DDE domain
MNAFSPLCAQWHQQVKEFFTELHGHQSKTLALFVWGAIKAQSIVLAQVAEDLLPECEAKVSSIERRLQRFVSNERIEVETVWDDFLHEIGASWKQQEVVLVLDLTPFEEHAQVVYVGLLQQTRVLPLAWKVMPGQEKWDQGLWEIVGTLFARVKQALGEADCTLIADRGLSGLPLIQLCQAQGWHYVLRIKQEELCQPWRHRAWQGWRAACDLVPHEGVSWYGTVRLWQEHALELQLSAVWQTGHQEAWLLISDRAAGRQRVREYRWRMRVESTFQDMKSRGWQWEQSHVRDLTHLNRMLLVLFLAFWWLMRLAASCIHNGRRERYDRHDRRDKGFLRLGRLYLLDLARSTEPCFLWNCLLFHGKPGAWTFSLRF